MKIAASIANEMLSLKI